MSREDKGKKGKSSGRQGGDKRKFSGRQGGGNRKTSYARGNSPIKKQTDNRAGKPDKDSVRLNKFISNSGICSRRDADIYIASGNVTVNGEVVIEMGYKVKLSDEVKVDGRSIKPEKIEYFLLNKPKGFVSATNDDKGRATVMDLLKNATKSRILPVGRLERNTTGLLLLTNDVDLSRKLQSPRHGVRKIYHVVLDKNLSTFDMQKIESGIRLDDGEVNIEEISHIQGASKREVGIKLHSNKNRVVKRIFESLGYEVVQLDRVVYAGLTKKDLPRGTWKKLSQQEIINLKML